MAHSVETNQMQCVFIETNLETRLGLLLHDYDDVFTIKGKICREHNRCFPTYGDITVSALKVNRSGQNYHLSDSVILTNALEGKDKLIHVDVLRVDEACRVQAATSNLQVLDSRTYDPTIKDCLTQQLADKDTKKRKVKSSVSEKIKHKVDPNQSCGKMEVESLAICIGKDIECGDGNGTKMGENEQALDANLKEPVGVEANPKLDQEDLTRPIKHVEIENKTCNKEDGAKDVDEAKSVKARKKAKTFVVALGAQNVEDDNLLTAETYKSFDAEDKGLKDRVDADSVSIPSLRENEMGTKEDNGGKDAANAKSVKARKKPKSKIVKEEDTLVASGAQNDVKDPQENVEKL